MDLLLFFSLIGVCAAAGTHTLRSSGLLVSDAVCVFGWMRNSVAQCRPVCESGCKHGECVGPEQCLCHPGYTGKTCSQDVNECAFRPCKHRCMNTLGSYKCYCLEGFMLTADGSCKNAHTCAMANCQYGCAVLKGAVRCQCPSSGLRLAADGRTCVDVDECVSGQASCPRFRKCVNTFGSYVCRCHEGFHLQHFNGKYHCTDKKLSICSDKPGHKKCKCRASINRKGYDCMSVLKVTIEPAKPVTVSPTTISMATTFMTTTTVQPTTATTIATTTARPTTTTTMATTTAQPTTTTMATTTLQPTTTTMATTTVQPTTTTMATTTLQPTTTNMATTTVQPTTTTMATTTAQPKTTTTMATTTAGPTTTTAMATTTAQPTTTTPMATTTAQPTTTTTTTTMATTTVQPTTTPMATATAQPTTTTMATTTLKPTTTVTMATSVPPTTTVKTVKPTTVAIATTTTTIKTTGPQMSSTTLDNHIHRESTAKPRGDVHIPRFENSLFDWDFDIELGEYTRDDPGAGVVSCSFDDGVCVWMTDTEGDVSWEIKDDPAGGRYLSVPDATNRRSIKGARLTVSLAPPTKVWQGGNLCLSFKHCLHGHHIGSLQVFVRKGRSHSPSIWTRTGGHGWRHTHITLWGRGLVDIVLKAERRRGKHGEIAVDDFSLRRGACEDGHNRTE